MSSAVGGVPCYQFSRTRESWFHKSNLSFGTRAHETCQACRELYGAHMSLVSMLLKLALLATPSVDALLLDMEVRDTFKGRWSTAMVSVIYRPPASPLEDQSMTPPLEVNGFALAGGDPESPWVAAPASRLAGVETVSVRYVTGRVVPGIIEWPEDGRDAPLVRIRVSPLPPGVKALRWADEKRVVLGRRAWVIERPKGRGPTGELMDPVLVDTSIGPLVEPPLERFWSARLREADGMPLLDSDGSVLCALYRTSPVDVTVAYCTTSEWAFEVPKRESQ